MNTRDRIIQYLDGQMSQQEISRFEEDLKNSPSLQNELADYRKLLNKYNLVRNIPVDTDYFVNLLPGFRKKISSQKKFKLYPVLGYSLITVMLIILFSVIFLRNGNEIPQTEDVISTLSDNETEYFLNNYSGTDISFELDNNNSGNYDSVLTNLIAENLVSENSDLNYIMENPESNFYNIPVEITESQADIIYNELINKKFF